MPTEEPLINTWNVPLQIENIDCLNHSWSCENQFVTQMVKTPHWCKDNALQMMYISLMGGGGGVTISGSPDKIIGQPARLASALSGSHWQNTFEHCGYHQCNCVIYICFHVLVGNKVITNHCGVNIKISIRTETSKTYSMFSRYLTVTVRPEQKGLI